MWRPFLSRRWQLALLALALHGWGGASPATDLYAAATREIRDNYYGWSKRDFRSLDLQYQRVLAKRCAPDQEQCSYDTGRRVLIELLAAFGDEHTYVRDPDSTALYREQEQDKPVARSGVRVVRVEGGLLVVSVRPGSPADRAGVHRFDLLIQVGGQDAGRRGTQDLPIGPSEFARMERTAGQVKVTLRRAGQPDGSHTLDTEVRPPRDAPSLVGAGAGGKVAVIEIPSFLPSSTASDFLRQVKQAQAAGVEALIVDLRFNGGGNLQQCVAAASIFGPVVYNANYRVGGFSYTGLNGEESRYLDTVFASASQRVWTGPAAVLVGPDTASCAEVFGYYAQRSGVKLVGAATKGVANSGILLRSLPDGGMLAVTVFRGYAPDDVALPGRLTPDVAAPLDLKLLTTEGRDTTLEAALAALDLPQDLSAPESGKSP